MKNWYICKEYVTEIRIIKFVSFFCSDRTNILYYYTYYLLLYPVRIQEFVSSRFKLLFNIF